MHISVAKFHKINLTDCWKAYIATYLKVI